MLNMPIKSPFFQEFLVSEMGWCVCEGEVYDTSSRDKKGKGILFRNPKARVATTTMLLL